MMLMKKFLILPFACLTFSLFAQQKTGVLAETDFVRIEANEQVCKSMQGFDYLFQALKFTNLTNDDIIITYNFEVWHEDICQTCGGDHGSIRSMEIAANSVVEATCKEMYNQSIMVLDHSLTVDPAAPKVKLTEIVINKVIKN